MNIPIELKTEIHDNELIVFVGVGLSFNLKNNFTQLLEGWSNLCIFAYPPPKKNTKGKYTKIC